MIADFHSDVLTADGGDLRAVADQTEACVCAAFGGGRPLSEIRELVGRWRREGAENLYLSLEDASYLDADTIEEVCSWRPVCVSLTWNGENALAGGCLSEGGMTLRGRKMVSTLSARGIALDCAHLNARSFCELLDCAPCVVDSHTCLCGVRRHPRNLEDWQVAEIVARGGLIGIAFVGRFLSEGYADARAVFRHFDYGIQKFGIEHFCFGTDFYGTQDLPSDLRGYGDVEALRSLFVANGYSSAAIDALFFGNLLGFLRLHASR